MRELNEDKSLVLEGSNGSSGRRTQFGLSRLIFSVVGIWGGYRLFSWMAGFYLLRYFQSSPNDAVSSLLGLAYPATAIFVLVEMLIVIWVYRPLAYLFVTTQTKLSDSLWVKEVFVGTAAGLLIFLITLPFLKELDTRTFFLTIFPSSHPIGPRSLMYAVLLGLALPTAGEIVFRGIVLRTLQSYAGPTAAILASTLLFVSIWPLFGVAVSLLLGVGTSLLFTWRKSLITPIFADIVMTICGGSYVLWRIWS